MKFIAIQVIANIGWLFSFFQHFHSPEKHKNQNGVDFRSIVLIALQRNETLAHSLKAS